MALFLHRLGIAAGISFSSTAGHNDFTDIGAFSAEIQGAINALADTRVDPQGHIVLGTGGSLFSPNDPVFRWAMALFLTRVLAADDIAAPAGLRVTVTPTDTVSPGAGTARVYTATFKNADGTPYTGAVGVMLRIVSSAGVVDWDGAATVGTTCPNDTVFEAPTDGLVAGPAGPTCGATLEGFPGGDGIVSFTVRHTGGAAERVVPVAWEDLNNDNDAEISGNNPPAEPYGVGGQVAFGGAVAAECLGAPTAFAGATVSAVDKTADRIEVSAGFAAVPCSIFYDGATDLFRIEGAGTDVAGFEAALNVGDVLGGTYDADTADQSTLDITTDNDPSLTVTDPAAGGVTIDAGTYSIKGTAVAGYTVRVYNDVGNDGTTDGLAGSTTAAADGTWTVLVNLSQNQANDFLAAQRPTPGGVDGPLVDVPTITESAAAAANLVSVVNANGGLAGFVDSGDTLTFDFNENLDGNYSGDSFQVTDGTDTATVTNGVNASFATGADASIVVVTINNPLSATINGATGSVQNLGGWVGSDGLAINVNTDPDRTFAIA
jgi:hypothetical protein